MKPRLHQREKDQQGKFARRSLELLSPEFINKNMKGRMNGRLTRQSASSRLQDLPRNTNAYQLALATTSSRRTQQESVSALTNSKKLTTPRITPITPKMITKCSELEKLAESTEQGKVKTVSRRK